MTYFYKLNGEAFVPEKINPDLVRVANAVIRNCKLSFMYKMKTTSLSNALKTGKRDQMIAIMQKCFSLNKPLYDQDMSLAGVTVEEVEDSFFDDKDDAFIKAQLQILIDFAAINTVIESNLMSLLSNGVEKATGNAINKIKFFTNQDVILESEDDDEPEE